MPTVLLIDDDAVYRRALRAFLDAAFDIDVVGGAGTAEEALAIAERMRPDAVVVDVAIPGSNGFDIARRLREFLPDLVVVFVTGSIEGRDSTRAEELGARLLAKGDPLPVENALRAAR